MFENVSEVEFHEKDYDRILSVLSREAEKVPVSAIEVSDTKPASKESKIDFNYVECKKTSDFVIANNIAFHLLCCMGMYLKMCNIVELRRIYSLYGIEIPVVHVYRFLAKIYIYH